MSLFGSVKRRMTNQFLALIVEEKSCKVKQRVVKGNDTLFVEESTFEIESKDKLSDEIVDYINRLQEEYEHTYITLFLNTLGQGVIPTCDIEALKKFSVDKDKVKTVCVENRYLIYGTLIDIKWADKTFADIGLDFVFSPFLVLDYFIKRDISDEEIEIDDIMLYVLNTGNALTVMIMKESDLLFGSFFNIAKDENLLYTDYGENGDDIFAELDFVEDDELLIENLTDIDDIPGFENSEVEGKIELSEQDERFVKYLSAALKEFYSNDLYESEFIQSVRIFDDIHINPSVVKYLKNELLLEVSSENVSVRNALIDLSRKEVFR